MHPKQKPQPRHKCTQRPVEAHTDKNTLEHPPNYTKTHTHTQTQKSRSKENNQIYIEQIQYK